MAFSLYVKPISPNPIYSRSPIVFGVSGCTTGRLYTTTLYQAMTEPGDLVLTDTIVRNPDSNLRMFIDLSKPITDYIKYNNFSYDHNNVDYLELSIVETYTGSTTGTISYTGYSLNGYTYYAQKGSGVLNIQDKVNNANFVLNTQSTGSTYNIPSGSHYELSFYKLENSWTKWRANYTKNLDDGGTAQVTVDTNIAIFAETNTWDCIETIYVGYGDEIPNINDSYPYTIQFMSGSTVRETYSFGPDVVCNYTTLQFMNKYGVWDYFYLSGRKDTLMNVEFENVRYNKVNNGTYNISDGQYHKNFVQGKNKYTMNTGWIDENKNNKVEELLLSEYVIDYTTKLPVIITTKDIKYKTMWNDRLFFYTFELEDGFEKINSIL